MSAQASHESIESSTALGITIREKRFQSAHGEELLAIRNLHIELERDKFTCIVGPSGCGKTTTLRILLGLDSQYDGNVTQLHDRRTSAVFQEPRLIPWRTVRQNVDLCVESAGEARDSESNPGLRSVSEVDTDGLDQLYIETGLDELLDFYPSELSLGLARRVALARAFAIEPQLLVLDEPFVSLDESTAKRLRQLLLSVWRARPTTALMVTHNLHEAAELADKVVVLSERPSSVLGNVTIDTPQAERDSGALANIVRQIEEFQLLG